MSNNLKRRLFKTLVHLVSGGLLAVTFYRAIYDQLGADPVEALIHFTGIGAVNLLLFGLFMSLVAKKLKQPFILHSRRLVGIYCFVYALAHLLSFILFEVQLDIALFLEEVIKRPYITVGMVVFCILSVLALTSFDRVKKTLGARWQLIHNWVYVAVPLAILHYCWSLKLITLKPAIYIIVSIFILWLKRGRLIKWLKKPDIKPGKQRA